MGLTVAVIAQGEMGSGIGARLAAHGARVLTSLKGRSEASAARAAKAGMEPVGDDARLVALSDFLLSVIPPGEAVPFARRFAPVIVASAKKPVFVECNAISPARVAEVAAILAPSGAPFIDGGIVGAAPSPEKIGGRIYVSGPEAQRALALKELGLDIRPVEGGIGAASAVKCSYAALTKGTQALGVALILGAMRAGVADALRQELTTSQPQLYAYLERQIPNMYRKAYRWVAEMEEIGEHLGLAEPGAREIYRGMARLYEHLGPDQIALLDAFLGRS
jgi:3-hydroxyisobutyrate dehydrogenase-like beta-hydroxyacid dehydrogenase